MRKVPTIQFPTCGLSLLIALLPASVQAGETTESSGQRAVNLDLSQGNRNQLVLDKRGRLRLATTGLKHVTKGGFVSAIVDVKDTKSVTVQWVEQWTTPLKWKKHPGNPIYGPKQTGAWDQWTNGVSVVRNPDGRSYKMFYSGRNGSGIGFAEALIDKPLSWKESPASPVLRPRKDNWEGNLLNQPRVVKVTPRHWRMYYTGWGDKGKKGSAWAFGLAESNDAGKTWKRVGDQPLMARGKAGDPDDGGAFVPEVRRVGKQWMM